MPLSQSESLRIPLDLVAAIIGSKGAGLKAITAATHARVVVRRDVQGGGDPALQDGADMCRNFRLGKCRFGDACHYAHDGGEAEARADQAGDAERPKISRRGRSGSRMMEITGLPSEIEQARKLVGSMMAEAREGKQITLPTATKARYPAPKTNMLQTNMS